MYDEKVDWNESVLQKWMGSISKASTKAVYKSGFKCYLQYTKLTATQMIDEALEDVKKDPREKTDIVKQRLIGFYNWIEKEAPKRKAMGRGVTEQVSKGLAPKVANTYVNAVRSFYGTYDVYVKLKGRSQLPRARVLNKRMILDNLQVKKLVDNARTLRDRAVVLVLFQGGMDVSTLCSLKYSDIAEGLAKNELPLKLELFREKAGIEHYTFLGTNAVEALKAYINDVKARGLTFEKDTPLFMKGSHKAMTYEGIEPHHVQAMMKELAIKSGFIDKQNNGKNFNPLGAHALRESFGSIMTSKGVPDAIVDFWLGHKISEMTEAYKSGRFEDVKQMYIDREHFISITTNGDLEQKLRVEIDEKNKTLQGLVNGLTSENFGLKERMTEFQKKIEALESHQKTVDNVLELLDLREEDAKALSEMIEDFQQRKRLKSEAERVENEKKSQDEILEKLKEES